MMPSIARDTPPFVRFEHMEYGTDAEASEKAGRPIPKIVPFALIMQHGSKDCVEKPAAEWLAQIRKKAIEGTFNPQWAERYRMQYEEWQKGNELPREGTPVKTCALFNGEQAKRLVALGITTVEDLAAQPDQSLGGIGLDGRVLRDMARKYIDDGKGVAGAAAKIAALEEDNRQKDETIKRLEERMGALEAALPADKKRETLSIKR